MGIPILQWKLCPCHLKLVNEVMHFSEAGFPLEPQAGAVWSHLAMGQLRLADGQEFGAYLCVFTKIYCSLL